MAAQHDSLNYTEQERLETLYKYNVLDTLPENSFNNIVEIAAHIFDVPVAFISFIDDERTWFKAAHGITATEMPRAIGLCSYTISQDESVVITDALQHDIARNNELVTGPMALRFYAAVPLAVSNGHKIGTLCIADKKSKPFSEAQLNSLQLLAAMAVEQLELRSQNTQQLLQQQDVLAHLSHELKNSISLVIGYASLLKETDSTDESHSQFCDTIFNAGRRMNSLVEEALVLAANRSPVFELKKEKVNLTALLKETVSRFDILAKEKQQSLQVSIAADITLDADPLKVNEIIENLLSNAIKYSALNKSIILDVHKADDNTVYIKVTDEGPGFTENDLQRLFQPFTRLSAKPTAGESSSGMGLYIAHKLVQLHGGKLWACNTDKGGAEFCVSLPVN